MEFIRGIKVIDAVALFIFLKAFYTATKRGIFTESIKLCAVFVASFFSFQYYPLLLRKFESDALRQEYLHFFAFCILFAAGIFLFFLLRKIVMLLLHFENPGRLQRCFALPLSVIHSVIFLSTVMFCFFLVPFKEDPFKGSVSYRFFRNVAPRAYILSFEGYKKIWPKAEKNKNVLVYCESKSTLGSGKNNMKEK